MKINPNPALALEICKGLHVQRTPEHLRLTYRWLNGRGGTVQILGELLFFLIGLAFFSFPLLSLTSNPAQAKSMTLLQWATTLPFLMAGGFIVYRGLGIFINTSVFEIKAGQFKTRNGPLPFLGEKNLTLLTSEIASVEWKQVGHPSGSSARGYRSGYTATYEVVLTTTRGQAEKILSGLNNRDYAFAIQGELSRFLER
jgi:hypothetical protein